MAVSWTNEHRQLRWSVGVSGSNKEQQLHHVKDRISYTGCVSGTIFDQVARHEHIFLVTRFVLYRLLAFVTFTTSRLVAAGSRVGGRG